jgi:hypothetical protein
MCLQLSSIHSACAILSSVACPALPYFFPHYLINDDDYLKKPLLNIKFVGFFHSRTVHLNIIKVFTPTDAQVFLKGVLTL